MVPMTLLMGRMHNLTPSERARLTTWLIDQRAQGNECPEITEQVLDDIVRRRTLEAHTRAERLLQFISRSRNTVGSPYTIQGEIEDRAYAWSESTSQGEVGFLLNYLFNRGWLDANEGMPRATIGQYHLPSAFRVTVDGYGHIAERLTNTDSSQAFVALWMNDE